jgi:hypothetical protein
MGHPYLQRFADVLRSRLAMAAGTRRAQRLGGLDHLVLIFDLGRSMQSDAMSAEFAFRAA